MAEFLRIAGAQIPVSADIGTNIQTIKDAIDWAAENNVNYLITPEGSLSGYVDNYEKWEVLVAALDTIEAYSAEKKVGLCLGTLWFEPTEDGGVVRKNQIRVYHNGIFRKAISKSFLSPHDYAMGIEANDVTSGFALRTQDEQTLVSCAGFICKDLYARESASENELVNLPNEFYHLGAELYIHVTNAERGVDTVHDTVHYNWHQANAEMVSWITRRPLITVDNCIKMMGEPYEGRTSSPSGVLICGDWVVQVPNVGKQYFYYDFPVEEFAKLDWTDYMTARKENGSV